MSSPVSVVDQVAAAMSVRSLQHQVIASNIANRDTQGYQRLELRFQQLMGGSGAVEIGIDRADVQVPLEQDLVALSSNADQYGAMARVLSRYFSMLGVITNYRG